MVPVPVAVSRKLGWGAGAASAVGTRLHDASAFFAGAGLLAINFCNSVMFSLSAASAKVRRGAWKFATLRFPLALVDPTEATRFVTLREFCVNCRLAFLMFSGWVSEGIFSEAFWIAPVPLKFIASVFLIGPVAWTSMLTAPLPLMPSTALTP